MTLWATATSLFHVHSSLFYVRSRHPTIPKYAFLRPSNSAFYQPSRKPTKFYTFQKTGKIACLESSSVNPDLEANGQSEIDTREQQETFTWSSTFLPFLFPALGGLLFGYDIGATSGATLSLQSANLSGISWYNFSSIQTGLVVSGSLYGALCGSILAFNTADFLGRRRELIIAAALYFSGSLITGLAPEFPILITGRLLYGLGIGLAMHAAPLYIAETCPSQIRGTLVSFKEMFIVLGILLGYFVSNLEIDELGGWRIMYGLGMPVSVIMGFGMSWLPPSPRWLLLKAVQSKEHFEELKNKAVFALSRLSGRPVGDKSNDLQIEETLKSLQYSFREQMEETSLFEIIRGKYLKAFSIGGGLVFFQQITGQPSVLYYAASILQSAGFSAASDATRVSIVLGVFKLLMTGVAVLKVDELGRKPLLIGGIGGIVVSLLCLAVYYSSLGNAPILAVLALLLFVSCYQISFGPISWLMVSEIFPLRARGRGISVAVLVNFATNALVTFLFSPLEDQFGPSALFAAFAAIAILSLLFVIYYVPETKGLSLEDIESKVLR